MLDHSLADLPGEVQAGEFRKALLELGHNAQGLPVVVKATEILHESRESNFTGVPKGGVPKIMCQTDGFHQIFVAAQGTRERSSNLGNFEGVRQARPKVIAFVVDKDLSFVFKASKPCRVKDSIPVPLEGCAVFRFVIQIGTTLRVPAAHAVRSKAFIFDLFKLLTGEIHGRLWWQRSL